eukprot:Skav230462  [mRNA]  locus=scaffold186:168700:168972:- [translate_table: standard]
MLSWILLYFTKAAKSGMACRLLGKHRQQLAVVFTSVSSRTQSKYSMPLVYFRLSSSEMDTPKIMRPLASLANALSRLSLSYSSKSLRIKP